MTTGTAPLREYTAKVLGVSKQQKGDGWVLQTEARQGMQYPDSLYGKDWALVRQVQPGNVYTLQLERQQPPKLRRGGVAGSLNPWDYWENLVSIAPAATPQATLATPVAATEQARPGQQPSQAEAPPWPAEQGAGRGESTNKSIEWQVAVKAAVEALQYMQLDPAEKKPRVLFGIILAGAHALFNRKLTTAKPGHQAPPATPAGQGQAAASQRKGTQAPAEDDPDTLPY